MKNITQIKIKGRIDKKWEEWFDGMKISYEDNNTLLTGEIKDDASMYGILNRIRDLNLKLISVYPLSE